MYKCRLCKSNARSGCAKRMREVDVQYNECNLYRVTTICNLYLQIQIETLGLTKLLIKKLDFKILNKVRRTLVLDNTIFPNLLCEDGLLEMPHKIKLITATSSKYLKIRLHSYAKFHVQNVLQLKRRRYNLTKQILFLNE